MNADTLKNIGMALSGLSAGIQGRGAEFANSMAAQQQAEEARRQKLSMERQQAMAIDARVVRDHLENALNPDGTVRDQKRLSLAMQLAKSREQKIAELGGDPSETQAFVSALEQDPVQALNLVRGFDMTAQEQGLVSKYEPPKFNSGEIYDARKVSPQGQVFKEVDGRIVAVDIPGYKVPLEQREVVTPPALLQGLTTDVAQRADAAFKAAGGGDKGMVALSKMLDQAGEIERKTLSPNLLRANFPNASEAELNQLQATMDASKTTEEGLAKAAKLREDQRRIVKAKTFKDRAVNLIDKILSNDQLPDVIGSIEGNINFRLSDAEAELINDIEEAKSILTADNMDLMVGVLSESDIKMLKEISGGALSRTRSEDRFRSDVTRLRNTLSGANIVTADDIQNTRGKILRGEPSSLEMLPDTGVRNQILNQPPEQKKPINWSDL